MVEVSLAVRKAADVAFSVVCEEVSGVGDGVSKAKDRAEAAGGWVGV